MILRLLFSPCMHMHAKSLQSCQTLWGPTDSNPADSFFHGILQARISERVTMPSSRGSTMPRDFFTIVKFAQSCPSLCDPMDYTVHGILQGNPLLQEIFPPQGLNPGLPHCRQILYQLSHKGSPRMLEWVAHPFSRGSSWPRNRTRVSCIAGGLFTNWAMREALSTTGNSKNGTNMEASPWWLNTLLCKVPRTMSSIYWSFNFSC